MVRKQIGVGKADRWWKRRTSNMVVGSFSTQNSQLVREFWKLKRMKMCSVCKDSDAAIMFLPCRHLTACEGCSSHLDTCNHCGKPIIATVKIYFA